MRGPGFGPGGLGPCGFGGTTEPCDGAWDAGGVAGAAGTSLVDSAFFGSAGAAFAAGATSSFGAGGRGPGRGPGRAPGVGRDDWAGAGADGAGVDAAGAAGASVFATGAGWAGFAAGAGAAGFAGGRGPGVGTGFLLWPSLDE